jgi:hypothetical protein
LRAGFAVAVVDFVADLAVADFGGCALLADDAFDARPNESARVVGCALLPTVGCAWIATGVAMIADAMRRKTFDCTALARRERERAAARWIDGSTFARPDDSR